MPQGTRINLTLRDFDTDGLALVSTGFLSTSISRGVAVELDCHLVVHSLYILRCRLASLLGKHKSATQHEDTLLNS
jgi:hypothetical protein